MLYAGHNALEELPDCLDNLDQLTLLNVSHNQLVVSRASASFHTLVRLALHILLPLSLPETEITRKPMIGLGIGGARSSCITHCNFMVW